MHILTCIDTLKVKTSDCVDNIYQTYASICEIYLLVYTTTCDSGNEYYFLASCYSSSSFMLLVWLRLHDTHESISHET